MYGKKDRFGNDLVNIFYVMWALRVLIWFTNYLNKVRYFAKKAKVKWNEAVSNVWCLIRSKTLRIKDTP